MVNFQFSKCQQQSRKHLRHPSSTANCCKWSPKSFIHKPYFPQWRNAIIDCHKMQNKHLTICFLEKYEDILSYRGAKVSNTDFLSSLQTQGYETKLEACHCTTALTKTGLTNKATITLYILLIKCSPDQARPKFSTA